MNWFGSDSQKNQILSLHHMKVQSTQTAMNVNLMQSFVSCLIQLVIESFLIKKHSVSFYIILLLLFVASYIFLQMFTVILSVLHSDVFLILQRYLFCAVIIPSLFNFQLLIKTHSWLLTCLIDLNSVVLIDTGNFLYVEEDIIYEKTITYINKIEDYSVTVYEYEFIKIYMTDI